MKVNSVYILCKLLLQQHKLCRFQVVVKLYLSGSFWRVYVYICSPTYKGVMLIQEFIFMTLSHPPWSNLTNSQKYARQKCLNLCISVSHLISVQCDIPENIHFYTCICYISINRYCVINWALNLVHICLIRCTLYNACTITLSVSTFSFNVEGFCV